MSTLSERFPNLAARCEALGVELREEYSRKEAQAILGLSQTRLHNLLKQGKLSATKRAVPFGGGGYQMVSWTISAEVLEERIPMRIQYLKDAQARFEDPSGYMAKERTYRHGGTGNLDRVLAEMDPEALKGLLAKLTEKLSSR
jgi:hypothetical protein